MATDTKVAKMFSIENGSCVTVYDNAAEFQEAVLDLMCSNEQCLFESTLKRGHVYVRLG